MFNLKKERIQWGQLLGRGSLGRVFPYQINRDDKAWVVKVISANDDKELLAIFEEIVLGFSCDHPGITPIKGYYIEKLETQDYKVYLKLPRMAETLKQKIKRDADLQNHYSEEQIVKYFYSLLCSVDYLHQKKIAHRDIKPANILLDDTGSLKLCDVGIAKFITDEESSFSEHRRIGAWSYTAPEVMNQNHHLKKRELFKADAWSLGLVVAEMCLLKQEIYDFREPFIDQREKKLFDKIKGLAGKYSEQLLNLILEMLHPDLEKRKNIEDAKKFLEITYSYIAARAENFQELGLQNRNVQVQREHDEVSEKKFLENITRITEFEHLMKQIQEMLKDKIKFEEEGKCILDGITDPDLPFIFESIRPLDIKEIDWKGNCILTESTLKKMRRAISTSIVPSISFHFDTRYSWLNDYCNDNKMKSFVEQLRENLRYLQSLSLDFERCPGITINGIRDLLDPFAKWFPSLQSLTLNFRSNRNIYCTGIKDFAEQIGKSLKTIEALSLNFSDNWDFSDIELRSLMKGIGNNLRSLNSFTLILHGNYAITDSGVQHLAEQLGFYHKNLQHLHLDFSWNETLTNNGLTPLTSQIGANLRSLQTLSLGFAACRKIPDLGVKRLVECIGANLQSLKHLSLNFSWNKSITDIGFTVLAKIIGENLKTLQSLTLDFNRSPAVTEVGLKILAEEIGKNLRLLKRLRLSFERYHIINGRQKDDVSAKNFAECLGNNLTDLKDFCLELPGFKFNNIQALLDWNSKH